ncbi:MAG: DUF2851 family protein [Lachnoclostridium sp.]|nr:DUF2851 family protein [Lachnoclostridium sp.]
MERLMQYVWQHRLLPAGALATVDGRPISIINPGRLNTDAGPDFFNAKVKIDGRLWAGDVEMHVRASDWHRHGHDNDPAYDSVILHVVDSDDAIICRRNGEQIPQMVLRCDPEFHRHYALLVDSADSRLPCASAIPSIPPIYITDWLSSLTFERLYAKTDRIASLLQSTASDWETVSYITIARALGFGTNAEPMERLARAVPLNILLKHADSPVSVESMLFGQSGLLDDAPLDDHYANSLRNEYDFMARKFSLTRPQSLGWKMARMRPPNFPHRRISLLASLVTSGFRLHNRIISVTTVEEAISIFDPHLSGYWADHYSFGPPTPSAPKALSISSARILVINAIIPLMAAYASVHGDDALWQRAVSLLAQLPPESNSIVTLFATAGIRPTDAATTQALIQLRRNYCEAHKCLYCRLGHHLLASQALRPT